MTHSTLLALLLATPVNDDTPRVVAQLQPHLRALLDLVHTFLTQPVTPTATFDFETQLQQLLRNVGRDIVAQTYNHLDTRPQPDQRVVNGECYRRRSPTPNTIATLFGSFTLKRTLYEDREPGNPCLFPLEKQLGLVAGVATPALAERAAWGLAHQSQGQTLQQLEHDHDVHWSAETLRRVTQTMAKQLDRDHLTVKAEQVVDWLKKAASSRGRRRISLVAGRDGIMVPMRGKNPFKEGSTATLTVYNRRGQRVGTVYLGRMPEAGQGALSHQLTTLLEKVLTSWTGPLPRLAYVTDNGHHPAEYYRKVLSRMCHPLTGDRLDWIRVGDYYHAASYIKQLAEALFGETARGKKWQRRMRRRLKEKDGVKRVLQSAAMHRKERKLTGARASSYTKAYGYLHRQRRWLNYWEYKRLGLPLGSGVTEAGCKTLFTQRLKQSGMRWDVSGGQVVLTLRSLVLSGVWSAAMSHMLTKHEFQCPREHNQTPQKQQDNAA